MLAAVGVVVWGPSCLLSWARDSSMSRMARVASKPFMMGMLMSVVCMDGARLAWDRREGRKEEEEE